MAAAVAQLVNARGAFGGFAGALGQTGRALQSLRGSVSSAGRSVEGIRRLVDQSGPRAKEFKGGAESAARAVDGVRKQASGADPAVRSLKSAGQRSARELSGLRNAAGSGATAISFAGKTATTGNRLSLVFGKGLRLGSGVMKAINVTMKTSPWGLVIGLLAPVAEQLVTMALESKTGQRLMELVFGLVEKEIQVAAKLIGLYVGALTGIVTTVWNGLRSLVRPTLDWITKTVPGFFGKVRDAMARTLGGIGDFVMSAAQAVLGGIKGPISGIVAFANMIIDGLNSLSFSFFGKKFGVHLSRIPELAHGGVVPARPGGRPVLVAEAGEAEAVVPLSVLRRLLARTEARARAGQGLRPRVRRAAHIDHYHEAAHAGPYGTAEDLLFRARTRR
ncbi:hypothetical protein AB0K09_08155 [Streptomyces sp. NPDC049577]|uniref:hypothetical protein n=1 Tax=Streptomyces sp. NPDC049577 TaxID=3155153 RepID=UPI00343528D2